MKYQHCLIFCQGILGEEERRACIGNGLDIWSLTKWREAASAGDWRCSGHCCVGAPVVSREQQRRGSYDGDGQRNPCSLSCPVSYRERICERSLVFPRNRSFQMSGMGYNMKERWCKSIYHFAVSAHMPGNTWETPHKKILELHGRAASQSK
jgi:hypothetical protein